MLSGVAVVEDSGILRVNGQRVALWGIDMLTSDQKCWQGETSWCCGEEALMALKHYAGGRLVHCDIKAPADASSPALATCYRSKAGNKIDIAEYLVKQGWALERGVASGGLYYDVERTAQSHKRGAWAGRFQTAQDWKDGVQRFVGEDNDETFQSEMATDNE